MFPSAWFPLLVFQFILKLFRIESISLQPVVGYLQCRIIRLALTTSPFLHFLRLFHLFHFADRLLANLRIIWALVNRHLRIIFIPFLNLPSTFFLRLGFTAVHLTVLFGNGCMYFFRVGFRALNLVWISGLFRSLAAITEKEKVEWIASWP